MSVAVLAWVSELSSIATFITALATFLTIWEMRRQRRSSYSPVLSLTGTEYRVWVNRVGRPAITPRGDESLTEAKISRLTLNAANVGNGTARNLVLKWSYDLDAFVALLNEMNVANRFRIELSEHFLEINRNDREGCQSYSTVREDTLIFERSHLAPMGITTERDAWPVPFCYLDLHGAYTLLVAHQLEATGGKYTLPSVPSLFLSIEYCDLDNHSMSAQFEVRFEPYMLRHEEADGRLQDIANGGVTVVAI